MKFLFLVIFILFSCSLFAQDNIIQKDGSEIKCKVLEVQLELVQYKRFENLDGPTYTIPKSQIFMIQYENGTKDVFELNNKDTTILTSKLLPDSLIIHNYIFFNNNIRIGLFPDLLTNDIYTGIGFTIGLDLELGAALYFAPKKMPKNVGVGLSLTVLNIGYLIGNYSTSFAPYSTSLGPQFSYRISPKIIFDLYAKPGMSLIPLRNHFQPAFLTEVGFNLRIKYLMVGINGTIIPTVYDSYQNTPNGIVNIVPYNFSHLKIRIGFNISKGYKNKV